MAVDWGLAGFLTTIGLALATFVFRKRLFRAILRGLLISAAHVDFDTELFGTWTTQSTDDGVETRTFAPNARSKAFVEGLAPLFVASALKSIRMKPPPGGVPGPSPLAGLDLTDLTAALPTIIGMLPKKYQAYAALAAPLIQKLAPNLLQQGSASGGGSASPKADETLVKRLQA